MLDLWNVLNDVMRTDPWLSPLPIQQTAFRSTLDADVAESDEEFWISAELPGVPLENVKLQIEDDLLTLSAVRQASPDEGKRRYHRLERRFGSFSRAFQLPKGVNRDDVQATMKDGVLTIRLPKEEQARRRQIPVRVAALGAGEAPVQQLSAAGPEHDEGK